MAQSYIFISYSRQDRGFVEGLASALRHAGVHTWTDLENISAGEDWPKAIETGLMNATALIYVSSKHSVQSAWMNSELQAFLDKSGRVIPVVIDDEGASHLPPPLMRVQWADFRGAFEPALDTLLRGIRDLRDTTPVATPVAKSKGYLFISYADEDSEFVRDLTAFLSTKEYAHWDFRESDRDYQADYTLELERVIKEAAGTLSIISPEWKRSRATLQELHFSREVGTPVFLLKLKDPGPTLAIAGMTHIDFSKRDVGFAKLDSEMRRHGL